MSPSFSSRLHVDVVVRDLAQDRCFAVLVGQVVAVRVAMMLVMSADSGASPMARKPDPAQPEHRLHLLPLRRSLLG